MKQHKFTIIVPTRERAETLYWCLKTLVAQDYENLEILVSDNFSQDNTKEVVDSFQDKRIKYINTGKRLEMTSNWEFALSHVTEGYVHYIGDDDGVLIGGIKNVNKIANLTNQKVIACSIASYSWANTNWADFGTVPISKNVTISYAHELLKNYEKYNINYLDMLSIYHKCFVHIDVINHIKNSTGGKFFQSATPDVYSSLILPRYVKEFALSFLPITIGGTSKRSTGAGLYDATKMKSLNLFFSELKDFPFDENFEQIRLLAAVELDTLFKIESADKKTVRVKWALPKLLKENQQKEPSIYKNNLEQIEILSKKYDLSEYYQSIVQNYPNKYQEADTTNLFDSCGLFTEYNSLRLNCKQLNIQNIYDFSVYVSTILNFKNNYTPIFTKYTKLVDFCSLWGRRLERLPIKLFGKAV
jgi:glycosyltransferase involved in cell wall biosynthesis